MVAERPERSECEPIPVYNSSKCLIFFAHFPVSGSELPRVPKVHQHVRPVQQGVDQGKDIRPAATSRGDHRLEERVAPLGSASQSPSAKPSLLYSEFPPGDVKPSNILTSGTSYVFISLFPPFS